MIEFAQNSFRVHFKDSACPEEHCEPELCSVSVGVEDTV